MVSAWPAVSYDRWRATCDTLHAHTQVLGKLAAKLAPPEPLPADPPAQDFIMRNAMDSQEVAVGWWPGDARYPRAAFYAYAHPAPPGFSDLSLSPAAAHWDAALGEYILDWDDVRSDPDPHAAALEFTRSAFGQACAACGWDTDLAATAEGTPPPVR
jgi:hypothetical protein